MKHDSFVFTMWTYNDLCEFTPDEMDVWVECGMTHPMLPKTYIGKDDPKALLPWLDRAQKLGIKLIVNYEDMSYKDVLALGPEAYEKKIAPLYEAIGNHPALYGFSVGDEPEHEDQMAATFEAIRINKKLAPHLSPFINYRGGTVYFTKEEFGGRDLPGWFSHVKDETGAEDVCFDVYGQMINDFGGKDGYFRIVRDMVDASKKAGVDAWGCLLSSGHHVYAAPNETEIRWLINMSAAQGLRGVQWFRFYDRAGANELYGSPIDEFGNKTEAFYGMLRSQRRFTNHYGKLIMKLSHKKTYCVKRDRGVYPVFAPGDHELIKGITANDETIVSFFEDKNGDEYIAVVHGETRFYGVVEIDYDREKCRLYEVRANGDDVLEIDSDDPGKTYMIPAGMKIIKIVRK